MINFITLISPQSLTNCKCKSFLGSVAEMKGNESRVVIYLQPVHPSKEGKVSTEKQSKWRIGLCSFFLILGTLVGLFMFGFVLFISVRILSKGYPNSDPESTTATTIVSPTTMATTTSKSTEPIKTTAFTLETKETSIPTATAATAIPSKGRVQKRNLNQSVDYHPGVPSAELLTTSISTICLYALVASSSLLLVFLTFFFAAKVDLKERAQHTWSRLRGGLPQNTKILLQTLSYYLAVTRSTCEVI